MTKPDKKIATAAAAPAPKAPVTEAAKAPEAQPTETKVPEAPEVEKASDPTRSRAKEIFDAHDPEKVKELFFTADGTAFFENQFALMHADSLKDQEIKTIKRSEV